MDIKKTKMVNRIGDYHEIVCDISEVEALAFGMELFIKHQAQVVAGSSGTGLLNSAGVLSTIITLHAQLASMSQPPCQSI